MSKHIGNDRDCHTRFHIVAVDPAASSVLVEYDENPWFREREPPRKMSWVEFVEGLRDGRFEIQRAD